MTLSRTTTITGGYVLMGDDLELIEGAVITVEDGVISSIDRVRPEVPSGAVDLYLPESVIVPGFIDMHVHIGFAEPREVLAGGVTAVLDLGWPPNLLDPLVEASSKPTFEGPLILAAGPILTAEGGYPSRAPWAPAGTAREVAFPGDARRAVAELVERGVSVIKVALDPTVGPTLDLECLGAIVEAAHANGRKVIAHISSLEELRKAVSVGLDALAHMLLSPDEIPDDLISEMVEKGLAVVPTLSIFTGEPLTIGVDNLRRFRGAGGVVLYGTDLGNEGPGPGIDPLEIAALQEAGMGTLDIIRAATAMSSAWLGLANKGALVPGKDADLIAVPRDALEDASLLCRPTHVLRAGTQRKNLRPEDEPRRSRS